MRPEEMRPEEIGPEEIAQRFAELGVLQHGHFRLSGGMHSDTYLQCALALSQPALALRLGATLADRVRDLRPAVVASPALGGVLAGFAVAAALDRRFVFTERNPQRTMTLRRGQRLAAGERVVVVEDVVTTGGSALEVVALAEAAGAEVVGLAAVVDRSGGLAPEQRPPLPVTALLSVAPRAWEADSCPRCAAGTALDIPGSRVAR